MSNYPLPTSATPGVTKQRLQATPSSRRKVSDYITKPEARHRLGVFLVTLLYLAIIVSTAIHGFGYYRLPLEQRPFHPLNRDLRPSGPVGLRMAFLGVATFCGIYLYSIRKHWRWLGQIGKT